MARGLDEDGIYTRTRTALVKSCLQTQPLMHPFWDVARYVRNFERGLSEAFRRYIHDEKWDHIEVIDNDDNETDENGNAVFVINRPPSSGGGFGEEDNEEGHESSSNTMHYGEL